MNDSSIHDDDFCKGGMVFFAGSDRSVTVRRGSFLDHALSAHPWCSAPTNSEGAESPEEMGTTPVLDKTLFWHGGKF